MASLEALRAVHSGELIDFVQALAAQHEPGQMPPPELVRGAMLCMAVCCQPLAAVHGCNLL